MGLFNLIFTLGVNRKPLKEGLNQAKSDVSNFGSELKRTLGGFFGAAALSALGKSILDNAGKLSDLSARMSVSTDMLQALDYAARLSGATIDDFTAALQRLAVAKEEALEDPESKQAMAFRRLGISVDTLKNARLEDLLVGISNAMRDIGDSQVYMADALTLMGKSAGIILPAMSQGFDDVKKKAEEAGQVLSPFATKELDAWGDKWTSVLTAVKNKIGEFLGGLAYAHKTGAAFVDVFLALGKAPFTEDGWRELQMAYNRLETINKEYDNGGMFKIPWGEAEGVGITPNKFGEWQGPPAPPIGWKGNEGISLGPSFSPRFSKASDSLVSVGNFLGADTSSAMRSTVTTLVSKVAKIEQNTKRIAENAMVIRK